MTISTTLLYLLHRELKKSPALTLILTILAITSCTRQSLTPGEAQFSSGVVELHEGNLERATELFSEAENVDPARPWRALGKVYEQIAYKTDRGAMKLYEKLIDISPDFDSGYVGFCRIALDENQYFLCEKILELYAARFGLVATTSSQKSTERAKAYALLMSRLLGARGKYADAEAQLRRAIGADNSDGRMRFALADIALASGDYDRAMSEASEAIDLDENEHTLRLAVAFHTKAGYADSALYYLEKLEDETGSNLETGRLRIETLIDLDYLEYARQANKRMLSLGAPEYLMTYYQAKIAEADKKYQRAYMVYQYALTLEMDDGEVFRDLGRVAALQNNFILMEDEMKTVMLYATSEGASSDYIAETYLAKAEYELITRQYRQALYEINKIESVFGKTPRLEFTRIHALANSLLFDSAKTHLRDAISMGGTKLEWLLGIGNAYIAVKEPDTAKHYFDLTLQKYPNNKLALEGLIKVASIYRDSVGFLKGLERVVSAFPRDVSAAQRLAQYYAGIGQEVKSLDLMERAIALRPGKLKLYNFASNLASNRYGIEQGKDYIYQALENNPDLPDAHYIVATLHFGAGNFDSTSYYIGKALALDYKHLPSLVFTGLLQESYDRPDSAIEIYKSLIELDYFYAEAYHKLALVLINNKIDLDNAANLARKAINLSGGIEGSMHGTLGWAYYNLGRYKMANTSFAQGIKLDPLDPLKRFMSAMNYEKLEKTEQALNQYNKALELGISGPTREIVIQSIDRLRG
ncbi:MAG: tetratricopeptide repeat protein [candidate division Zixibacteria bacterium]|nr:tetratricopeptide repeat protein [candidate division Zixibacteria bacterium]